MAQSAPAVVSVDVALTEDLEVLAPRARLDHRRLIRVPRVGNQAQAKARVLTRSIRPQALGSVLRARPYPLGPRLLRTIRPAPDGLPCGGRTRMRGAPGDHDDSFHLIGLNEPDLCAGQVFRSLRTGSHRSDRFFRFIRCEDNAPTLGALMAVGLLGRSRAEVAGSKLIAPRASDRIATTIAMSPTHAGGLALCAPGHDWTV